MPNPILHGSDKYGGGGRIISGFSPSTLRVAAYTAALEIAPGDFPEPFGSHPPPKFSGRDVCLANKSSAIANMVEGGGFEPPKAEPSDLQSDPFGHSGTPPKKTEPHILLEQANSVNKKRPEFHLKFRPLCLSLNKPPTMRLIAKYGAGTMSRTRDLLITSQLLYHLSYAGLSAKKSPLCEGTQF